MTAHDAIVVGAGPNGLAAAIVLARAGWSVQVREAEDTVGGGVRSAQLTLPGYVHDVCSAIYPLVLASPFMQTVPLSDYGVEWIHPVPLAHPFDDGSVALLQRSVEATGATLDQDANAYQRLMQPLVTNWDRLVVDLLAPLRIPRHPFVLAGFGLKALQSVQMLTQIAFAGPKARGMFAGIAAHSFLRMDAPISASFGLVLGASAHAVGWPLPRGGAQTISDALAAYFRSLGGEIVTDSPVNSMGELPSARAVVFDVTPAQLVHIAGDKLPVGYRRQLERYRYGPGVFKVDFALNGPIPWKAVECASAGTVHLGGTFEEIASSEYDAVTGKVTERPFVLVAQQSLFDSTRAPDGKHTVWAYCHVPHGSTVDMTARIENQIERFAPGFKDLILAKHVSSPATLEQYNANYVGGDINGGVQDWRQLFTRPAISLWPYSTPAKNIYICSSSTPPGGGVHGMCGYFAAKTVVKRS